MSEQARCLDLDARKDRYQRDLQRLMVTSREELFVEVMVEDDCSKNKRVSNPFKRMEEEAQNENSSFQEGWC